MAAQASAVIHSIADPGCDLGEIKNQSSRPNLVYRFVAPRSELPTLRWRRLGVNRRFQVHPNGLASQVERAIAP
jgi:hypothetical protein